MIQAFIDNWENFGEAWISGWLMVVLLASVGVFVVARDQIFIGAAVGQASTLGIALAMLLGGVSVEHIEAEEHLYVTALAVLFAVAASLVIAWRSGRGRETHEAITGWVFLISSSLSVVLLVNSPHGQEELRKLLAPTILGATREDLWLIAGATALTLAGLAAWHRRLRLLVMDSDTAAALGMRVTLWQMVLAAWVGAVIGLTLSVGGVFFTFGCLVLPPLIAKNTCRAMWPMFIVSPAVGLAAVVGAFVVANDPRLDLPPAQTAVAAMGMLMLPAWAVRRLRR